MQNGSLPMIALAVLACSSEAGTSQVGSDGGRTGTGSGGSSASSGGASATSGGTPVAGSNSNGGAVTSGGAPNASGGVSSTGGTLGSGSALGGTSGLGGADSGGGKAAAGGAFIAGASSTGGRASGGSNGNGGSSAGGSSAGGSSAGGSADSNPAAPLDGLRIDDPCAGTPATTDGATCNHVMLTNNQFKSAKEVTIGGAPGTSYDVTLRVRGVVEPSNISGGTRTDTTTFSYKDQMWRKVPFTIGGTVTQADYQQWHIRVASPSHDYYLNDYQKAGHFIFKLDYQVTIEMAANTKVTLDCSDSNERQIDNFEKYTLEGIPGSMNSGQFVQLNVVSIKPH